MADAAFTRTDVRRDPNRRLDGSDVSSWSRLTAATASPAGVESAPSSRSVHLLGMIPQPAPDDAGVQEPAASIRSRVYTGLALVAMGGLLMLAWAGHPWAVDLVRGAWPLFILAVGFCTVMVVTDPDDIVGKVSVVAGLVILFTGRFGIMPEATLRTLGPWAFVMAGLAIALSGVGLRVRRVGHDERQPSADLSCGELIEMWGSRGRTPASRLPARRRDVHDAEVATGPTRPLPEVGAECSVCHALGNRRESPVRPHPRTDPVSRNGLPGVRSGRLLAAMAQRMRAEGGQTQVRVLDVGRFDVNRANCVAVHEQPVSIG
jgi:hypothetical protein